MDLIMFNRSPERTLSLAAQQQMGAEFSTIVAELYRAFPIIRTVFDSLPALREFGAKEDMLRSLVQHRGAIDTVAYHMGSVLMVEDNLKTVTEIAPAMGKLMEVIESYDTRIATATALLQSLPYTNTNERIDALEQKTNELEQRLNNVEAILSALMKHLNVEIRVGN